MVAKIITVAQQKGGAGKTTVAAHLAVAWAASGRRRVAIIDTDPQGSLTQWHKVREQRMGDAETNLTFAAISGWRVRSEIDRLVAQPKGSGHAMRNLIHAIVQSEIFQSK